MLSNNIKINSQTHQFNKQLKPFNDKHKNIKHKDTILSNTFHNGKNVRQFGADITNIYNGNINNKKTLEKNYDIIDKKICLKTNEIKNNFSVNNMDLDLSIANSKLIMDEPVLTRNQYAEKLNSFNLLINSDQRTLS